MNTVYVCKELVNNREEFRGLFSSLDKARVFCKQTSPVVADVDTLGREIYLGEDRRILVLESWALSGDYVRHVYPCFDRDYKLLKVLATLEEARKYCVTYINGWIRGIEDNLGVDHSSDFMSFSVFGEERVINPPVCRIYKWTLNETTQEREDRLDIRHWYHRVDD